MAKQKRVRVGAHPSSFVGVRILRREFGPKRSGGFHNDTVSRGARAPSEQKLIIGLRLAALLRRDR